MSVGAAEDWEATGYIFDDGGDNNNRYNCTTTLDNTGRLLRGSIDLACKLSDIVFCRRINNITTTTTTKQNTKFRFWTLSDSDDEPKLPLAKVRVSDLRFRVIFFCKPPLYSDGDVDDGYTRLQITLLSPYPHSFPQELKDKWLDWLYKASFQILQQEQCSYSVCIFIENKSLQYFETLYQNEDTNQHLVCFDDPGPAFYEVPTITTDVKQQFPFQLTYTNGTSRICHNTSCLTELHKRLILPLITNWRQWFPVQCPICLESVSPTDTAFTSCDHGFCTSCLTMYLTIKAKELKSDNPNNPFICPLNSCRQGMKIIGFVKKFLPTDLMDDVREWYKDIKNPPCYSLPGCIKKSCTGTVLRKEAVDSFMISCEVCCERWCELCLQRVSVGIRHEDTPNCKIGLCQKFCEQYLAASDEAKAACERKFPWIKLYAKSRVPDNASLLWIKKNGQICPGCKTGIERTEGCFHISCSCGTHFCYECGDEIFYPYYGTHHCWDHGARQWDLG